MEIIPVYNIKGGVGKTTTAVNLAYLSACAGWRTLLWDLDPQAASTYLLRTEPRRRGVAKKLVDKPDLLEILVKETGYKNLDLLPADFSSRDMDLRLSARKKRTTRFLKLMRPLRARYDMVFLDCAPGMSLVSENVMHAADIILVPTLPSPLSMRMLLQLQDFIAEQKWQDIRVLPFFSMVDRRRLLHRDAIARMRKRFDFILQTEVPYFADIERMTVRRAPLSSYAPSSPGALVYQRLWREIERRMDRTHGVHHAPGLSAPM